MSVLKIWRHAVMFLLPVEVRRVADPVLPADIRHGYSVHATLQNECLLRLRELARLDGLALLLARGFLTRAR